jgi:hypothetical protein
MASGSFFPRIKLSTVTLLKTSSSEVASSVTHCLNHHHHTCLPTWILPGFPTIGGHIVLSPAVHPLSGASPSGLPGLGCNKFQQQMMSMMALLTQSIAGHRASLAKPPRIPEPKVKDPDIFDGSTSKVNSFITKCKLWSLHCNC